MIKVEPCRGCGRILMVEAIANLSVRLESEPLDAQEAATALVAGRNLWRITQTSASGARPAELGALRTAEPGERPYIVQEHACTATGAPRTPSPVLGDPSVPKGRQTGTQGVHVVPSTPSSDRQPERSSVPSAVSPRSEGPRCDGCSRPCADGTYASIEVGELTVWAHHVTEGCQA